MSDIKRESPLIGRVEAFQGARFDATAGIALRERPFLGHISLRGKSDDSAFTAACTQALGVELPTKPNRFAGGEGVFVCWMGPTEWLVLTQTEARQGWLDSLRGALGDIHSAVTDLSGGQTLIEVCGNCAPDVLSKGTTIDLHPRHFGAGCCTRTQLAKSTAFIRVAEPGRAFEVVVRRSFADYLWQWLCDASHEYGCAIEPPESALQKA